MSYATIADLESRFDSDEIISLAPSKTNDGIDSERVGNVLADADAEINSYLSGKYTVPVADVPLLKAVACDIARYLLYDNQTTEAVEKRYLQRISWLKDVARGVASLDIAVKPVVTKQGGHAIVKRGTSTRLFTRDTMSEY